MLTRFICNNWVISAVGRKLYQFINFCTWLCQQWVENCTSWSAFVLGCEQLLVTNKQKTATKHTILASSANKEQAQPQSVLTHIKKEMTFYEATNECPKVLKCLKHCLESLPPSSVEAERCFSAAGLFITKLRSNLNDEMIDNLRFLRGHFKNQWNKLFVGLIRVINMLWMENKYAILT